MKNSIHYITTIIGLLLLGIGLYIVKVVIKPIEPQGIVKALPYICIALGCGIFGRGMDEIISSRAIKNYPEIKKQIEIHVQDERNIAIKNRAKAKGYDMMIFIFGALILALALMGIDLTVVLLLVFGYIFVAGYCIYYRCKYDKEM
ncbi:DUF6442 family protein [Clostridium sp. WILCCON 0269]|uniref:DUF6442 family protein n=1 Tax=Candidatus Clostridium eludens TaxID=3381663 RepID=A0ABW8SJI0_9CLOT